MRVPNLPNQSEYLDNCEATRLEAQASTVCFYAAASEAARGMRQEMIVPPSEPLPISRRARTALAR